MLKRGPLVKQTVQKKEYMENQRVNGQRWKTKGGNGQVGKQLVNAGQAGSQRVKRGKTTLGWGLGDHRTSQGKEGTRGKPKGERGQGGHKRKEMGHVGNQPAAMGEWNNKGRNDTNVSGGGVIGHAWDQIM